MDKIDMLLLAVADFSQQGNRGGIFFAVQHRRSDLLERAFGKSQIVTQHVAAFFADGERAQLLQVRNAAERQHALNQHIRVFHGVDRGFINVIGEADIALILQYPRMEEILVDAGQLGFKCGVEMGNDVVGHERLDEAALAKSQGSR